MQTPLSYRRWLAGFFLGLVAAVAIYAGIWIRRSANPAGCASSGYADGHFLAFCGSPHYGPFEHGYYYFGLNADAMQALKAAQVVVLGNSRTQLAFSSDAMADFFSRQDIRHYLLGFSHAESAAFARALIERHDLRPELFIIGADPFFTGSLSPVARNILTRPGPAELSFRLKQLAQGFHARSDTPARLRTVFRDPLTGRWHPAYGYAVPQGRPLRLPAAYGDNPMQNPEFASIVQQATSFLRFVEGRGSRVILTAPPSDFWSPAATEQLAEALGVPYIIPDVAELKTLDGGHLTASSATLWSQRFLKLAAPWISRLFPKLVTSSASP